MGLVTWTAVFTLDTVHDAPNEVALSFNGLIGAQLQREVRPLLRQKGWEFEEAWPEDHGWHSQAVFLDDRKRVVASFVTCPELDKADSRGHALDDRWRIVVGMDVGMFPRTTARRAAKLLSLAKDAEECCLELGARDMVWEQGALSPTRSRDGG